MNDAFTVKRARLLRAGTLLLLVLAVVAVWTARGTLRQPTEEARPAKGASSSGPVLTSREIARRAMAAVVQIRAMDVLGTVRGDGTGFFVSKDGLLATSLHVIKGAHSLEVETLYGARFDTVFLVGADGRSDLALLRVNGDNIRPLPLAGDDAAEVGEPVFVTGNPLGQTGTFTSGLVSAHRAAQGLTYLQISAPIAPGSSGGPVMNERGEVLGVTTLRLQRAASLNFAVPVRYLHRLVGSVGSSKPYARVLLPQLQRPNVFSTDRRATSSDHIEDGERDVIARQLHRADSLLKSIHGTAEGGTIRDSLAAGDSIVRTLTLEPGRQYVVTGYCDDHCTALSLSAMTPAGRVIDADIDVDDTPKLRFIAPQDGRAVLTILMSECDVKYCRMGVRTYGLEPRR
ncbi:MAG TPA: S1C family serine protease [Gemmatimonadaceae bacterium]|nr:S1C family serine protease [Gemmatimonadaceae bacterium]